MSTPLLSNAMTNISRCAPRGLRGRVSVRTARLSAAAGLLAAVIAIGGCMAASRHANGAAAISDPASVGRLATPFLHRNAPQILALDLCAPRPVAPRADVPAALSPADLYLAADRRTDLPTPHVASPWAAALRRGYDATAPPAFLRASV